LKKRQRCVRKSRQIEPRSQRFPFQELILSHSHIASGCQVTMPIPLKLELSQN